MGSPKGMEAFGRCVVSFSAVQYGYHIIYIYLFIYLNTVETSKDQSACLICFLFAVFATQYILSNIVTSKCDMEKEVLSMRFTKGMKAFGWCMF